MVFATGHFHALPYHSPSASYSDSRVPCTARVESKKDSDTNANANAYETTANENDGEGGVEDIDTIKSGNASAEVKIAESAEKLELEVLSRDESVVGGLRSINAAAIPVFQVAFTLIKECLWKDEVGSWGNAKIKECPSRDCSDHYCRSRPVLERANM